MRLVFQFPFCHHQDLKKGRKNFVMTDPTAYLAGPMTDIAGFGLAHSMRFLLMTNRKIRSLHNLIAKMQSI